VTKKALESLIKSGAFDSLGEHRSRLSAGLEGVMDAASAELERRASAQVGLFGGKAAEPKVKLPNLPEWPIGERMQNEKEALGLFITGHPMSGFADEVGRWASGNLGDAERMTDDREVKLAGMIAGVRVIRTKKGDKMAFVTIEDERGTLDCVFFSDAYAKHQAILGGDRPILVTGKVERRNDSVSLRADSAERLEDLREKRARVIEVHLKAAGLEPESIGLVQGLFSGNQGAAEARIKLQTEGWTATVAPGDTWKVAATPRLVEGLKSVPGVERVVVQC
jgi:DNA polymerase-3 subunit alpha